MPRILRLSLPGSVRARCGSSLLVAALAVLAAVPPVTATTLVALDLGGLVDRSTVIVVGTPVDFESEWRDGLLVTVVRLRVERTLAGDGAEDRTVVVPGGIDTDRPVPVAMTLPGAPILRPGERAVFFLHPLDAAGSELGITGLGQGMLSLLTGADGKPAVATSGRAPGRTARDAGRAAETGTLPLAALEAFVAERIRARTVGRTGEPAEGGTR